MYTYVCVSRDEKNIEHNGYRTLYVLQERERDRGIEEGWLV